MIIYASGGDKAATPDWFVGYLPSLDAAIVAHEGTNPDMFKSVLVYMTLEILISPLAHAVL